MHAPNIAYSPPTSP